MKKHRKHKTVIITLDTIRVAFNTEYPLPDYFSIKMKKRDGEVVELFNVDRKGLKANAEIWVS